jgi:hypothetical protein
MNQPSLRPIALAICLAAAGALSGCGHESAASSAGAGPVVAAPQPELPAVPVVADEAAVAQPADDQVAAAPSQPQPKGQRPPADRTPRRPGEAEKISFDDLNLGMSADMVFREFLLTDRVKELDGQRVSIMGYMHAGAAGKGIKEFVLLKNTECKFGPGGQADHLAKVYLEKGQATEYQLKALKIEGTLKIEAETGPDGNTWSIYRLDNSKVVR